MAYASELKTNSGAGLFSALRTAVARLAERRAKYRMYRETLAELSGLSNRELADLGLHRSMLTRVAYQAAYGD